MWTWLVWRRRNDPTRADIHGIWMLRWWMRMKKNLSCGFSRPWLLVYFVRPPNVERAGVLSSCIKGKGRSSGEDHQLEWMNGYYNRNLIVIPTKMEVLVPLLYGWLVGIKITLFCQWNVIWWSEQRQVWGIELGLRAKTSRLTWVSGHFQEYKWLPTLQYLSGQVL